MLNPELRQLYRGRLINYYFNNQQFKDVNAAKRQVVNMDDKALENDYNRVFNSKL